MGQLCRESLVDELLRDPVARLLMKRDGVDEAALRRLLAQVGRRIAPDPDRIPL